jgi:uncharacterized membrane protein
MDFINFFYSLGEGAERAFRQFWKVMISLARPRRSEHPPSLPISGRLIRSKGYTVHELLSLHLQLSFLAYLSLNALAVLLPRSIYTVFLLGVIYLFYLRTFLAKYGHYLIEEEPYRFFYLGVSSMAFFSFLGFAVLREFSPGVYYYYAYVTVVVLMVLLFRWYFKGRFGRDYTFGVVEEVKNDLIRVFVNDDISANVKPGRYWLPATPDAEPGRVVKLLVEERVLRSAVPVRVLEVYIDQSSKTDTEPKEEAE